MGPGKHHKFRSYKLNIDNNDIDTWTKGHDGSLMWSSALAARAPLRKVGPKFIVIEENQIIKRPKATHWGLSLTISSVSWSASSRSEGTTGVAFKTVVRRFTWLKETFRYKSKLGNICEVYLIYVWNFYIRYIGDWHGTSHKSFLNSRILLKFYISV